MILLITYVMIALGFSFLCSLLEATLLSVSPSFVHTAKQKGETWAVKMSVLKKDVDKPLSAILTLNTIAHTMGAAGAGAEYARIYNNRGEAIFAGVLTFAILIFTEIIPKTLGAKYSSFFAKPTAHFLPFLQTILGPIVWFCGFITRMITFGGSHGTPQHREVMLAAAEMGEEEGQIPVEESAVVKNILRLSQMSARDIMTPRSVIFMVPSSMSKDDFIESIVDKPFSRIPVFGQDRDDITGVVLRSEVLLEALRNKDWSLEVLQRDVIRTMADVPLDELMRSFLKEGHHITLVTDKFGTVTGLLTLEDILETVVGVEIMDESDQVADLQELARQLWKSRAERMGIKPTNIGEEMNEALDSEETV
jgi:magnesium and cobalt exporter, CNNM family